MDLSDLKRSESLLLAVLDRERVGQHVKCAFHEEKHGSMAVWQGPEGIWLWKCHSGCGGGTIIDAAKLKWGTDFKGAVQQIERELGVSVHKDVETVETRIDVPRAERLVVAAHKTLMDSPKVQTELLAGKRGIRNLDEVRHYRLGYIERAKFKGWGWELTGWVLPVTNGGKLVGVKIHTQGMLRITPEQKKIPKCLWAPFGLSVGKGKPKHSALTLWPEPERWEKPECLWLCPGELKAIAVIGGGFPATSSTAGEGSRFAPFMLERIQKCKPGCIVLCYDDDKAGREWRDEIRKVMTNAGLRVRTMSGKQLIAKAQAAEPVTVEDDTWEEGRE